MKRIIAFYPELSIELGGIPEAIYYQQLYYWRDKGNRPDGFIYKTKEEIEEETTLSREQQDRIKKKLIDLGWLEVKRIKANGAPTLHYKTLKDLSFSISGKDTNQKSVNHTNVEKCKSHESITKITQKNTTDIKNQATGVRGEDVSAIIFLFKDVNPVYEEWYGNRTQRAAVSWMIEKFGFAQLEGMVKMLPAINAKPYVSKSTTPYELKKNLGKLKAHFDQENSNSKTAHV